MKTGAFWLMKSEPDAFSIDDLQRRPKQTESWDGVRNYQARNFMRQMKLGDQAFFYHSSCEVPGVVGIMRVVAEAYPDPTSSTRRITTTIRPASAKSRAGRWST